MGNGHIRVAPNGRYLQHADGTPFYSIGHSEAFGFFFQPMNPKPVLEAFLRDMRRRGENTLVVQVESEDLDFYGGHRLNLEWPLGTYHEDIASQFDDLLALCAENGVYVITYLWDTFHMDFNWEKSPYHVANGGPCRFVSEMLTHPVAIAAQEKKFKWAIDRWGDHPNLLAWELLNEIEWAVAGKIPANLESDDQYRLGTADAMNAWVTHMGRVVREYTLEKYGRRPLQTVSTNNPLYDGAWFYSHPEIDFVTNHQYFWDNNDSTYPATAVQAAVAVHAGVKTVLERIGYRKPYLETESGPLGWYLENPGMVFPIDDEYYHQTTWANWATGAAGAGMRWPYPNYGFGGKPFLNPLSEGMQRSLQAVARVAGYIDWNSFDSRVAKDEFKADNESLIAMACRDGRQMAGWIVQDERVELGALISSVVSFSGFEPGTYEVNWFDDTTGALLRAERAKGPEFSLETPAFHHHLAVVVRPAT